MREDARAGGGEDAVVEERAENGGLVGGASEKASAGGIVDVGVFVGVGEERAAVGVIAGADGLGGGFLVHVCEVVEHLGGGEHGDVVQVQRGEDVGLEVLVKGGGGYALDESAGPVNADLERSVPLLEERLN